MSDMPVRRPRALFISDLHLGTRGCKAEFLLDFLRHHEPETLYLVGDIVDGWSLKRSWHWDASHDAVVREIMRKARSGTRVVYVPGNHDEMLRGFSGRYAEIEIVREAVHETSDGRRLLVVHGDEHDAIVRYHRWIALAGDWGYQVAVDAGHWVNAARASFGLPYWSLAGYLKRRVKEAVTFIDDFENAVAAEAARRGFDGVACGHVHQARVRDVAGVLYANSGDWVDSCTALVEREGGSLAIVDWMQERAFLVHAGRRWQVSPTSSGSPAPEPAVSGT